MASSIISDDAVQGETFLPRQIFVFGGFALRANSLGHLEQIESYAPGRQVRFGSLNFTADIRGDLTLDGCWGTLQKIKIFPTVSPRSIYEFI